MYYKIKNLIFILLVLFPVNLNANETQAYEYTKEFSQKLFNIISAKKDTEIIKKELVSYLKENIDSKWTAKFVLGSNWNKMNATQKAQFTDRFEKYVIKNYLPKFKGYNNEKYTILKSKEVAPGKYISQITLILSDNTNLDLNIFIIKENNNFKIIDISVEGISFAATQRNEFKSLIATHGIEKFLEILEEKIQ